MKDDRVGPSSGSTQSLDSLRAQVARTLSPTFEVLRLLGSGRSSHVFLAREPALQRLVAVKVLRPEVGHSTTVRARFVREAHSVAAVHHPGVPSIYRVGRVDSGLPYIVQEFILGRTLRDRMDATGRIPMEDVRRIVAELAACLAASHRSGVIHRDVRPDNVMLEEPTGRVRLMDFGIAAVRESGLDANPKLTKPGESLGDPRYASPEQCEGLDITVQADVYSLGVLGYEMLTLAPPFDSDRQGGVVAGHLTGEIPTLPPEITSTDSELCEILRRCLQKAPERRPRAREISEALSRVPAGLHLAGPGSRTATATGLLAPFPRLSAFWEDLQRRSVIQVAVLYVAISAVTLEFAGNILGGIPAAPPWLYSFLVGLVLLGVPIVFVLAWLYDVSASGIRRTRALEAEDSTFGRILRIGGLIGGSLLLVGLLGWWFLVR